MSPPPAVMGAPQRLQLTAEGRWLGVTGLAFLVTGAAVTAPGIAAFGALILGLMASAHVMAVVARHRISGLAVRPKKKETGAALKALPEGSRERRDYLHRLGADPAVLAAQRL